MPRAALQPAVQLTRTNPNTLPAPCFLPAPILPFTGGAGSSGFTLDRMAKTVDLQARLAARREASPEEFSEALKMREGACGLRCLVASLLGRLPGPWRRSVACANAAAAAHGVSACALYGPQAVRIAGDAAVLVHFSGQLQGCTRFLPTAMPPSPHILTIPSPPPFHLLAGSYGKAGIAPTGSVDNVPAGAFYLKEVLPNANRVYARK